VDLVKGHNVKVHEPYKPTEFGYSRCWGLGDIRRRIRKRRNPKTESGRGRTDFRLVPEVSLVDLQMPAHSQIARYYRFRDIATLVLAFPTLPATMSYSTIAESRCASHMNSFTENAVLETFVGI